MSIPPDALLPVLLPAKDWNIVLTVLAEGPYRMVGPIIGEIQRQCMASAPQQSGQLIRQANNGGDAEVVQLQQRKPEAGDG